MILANLFRDQAGQVAGEIDIAEYPEGVMQIYGYMCQWNALSAYLEGRFASAAALPSSISFLPLQPDGRLTPAGCDLILNQTLTLRVEVVAPDGVYGGRTKD